MLARASELLPGQGHLFKLSPLSCLRGARHRPALSGMREIFVELPHGRLLLELDQHSLAVSALAAFKRALIVVRRAWFDAR
jgi:hypothetical protein